MTDINALIAEMRAGLEGVTPGPWRVDEQKHPYRDGTASHKEQRIVTTWTHPQTKACVDVTRLGVGIGLDGQSPIPMVRIEPPDAAHVARCSPANIAALLDEIDRLREAQKDVFSKGVGAVNAVLLDFKDYHESSTMEIERLRADNAALTAEQEPANKRITSLMRTVAEKDDEIDKLRKALSPLLTRLEAQASWQGQSDFEGELRRARTAMEASNGHR